MIPVKATISHSSASLTLRYASRKANADAALLAADEALRRGKDLRRHHLRELGLGLLAINRLQLLERLAFQLDHLATMLFSEFLQGLLVALVGLLGRRLADLPADGGEQVLHVLRQAVEPGGVRHDLGVG